MYVCMYVYMYLSMCKASSNKFNNRWQKMPKGISISKEVPLMIDPSFLSLMSTKLSKEISSSLKEKLKWLGGLLGLSSASFKDTMFVYACTYLCCQSLKLCTNSKFTFQILLSKKMMGKYCRHNNQRHFRKKNSNNVIFHM